MRFGGPANSESPVALRPSESARESWRLLPLRGWSNAKKIPATPPEVRERAVRMFVEHRDEYPSEWAAMTGDRDQARHDARDACAPGSAGPRSTAAGGPDSPPTSAQRLKDLEKENRELRRANEILKDASIFFATELDGRPKK